MTRKKVTDLLSHLTLEEKAKLCAGRDFWNTFNIDRLDLPSVMMCDGPNGLRKQLVEEGFDHLGINKSIETICYPTSSAMAASFDTDLLYELGEVLGQECQSEDVSMLLGPGINMKRSPLCGRNFEYYSEDPYLAGKLASAYIKGLQHQGVAACVKHFAANNQETNRMSGSSQVDERALNEIYLPAFEMAVKEGKSRGIMSAYNQINGTFASENAELLTSTLRDCWGYDGIVVSDWGGIKDRIAALKAGNDLEMPGGTGDKYRLIIEAVESGQLSAEELDKAVANVLTFIVTSIEAKQTVEFDRTVARQKALKFAQESSILLKNTAQLLPLKKEQKVAFIGEFAETPRYQGAGSSFINVSHPISALDAISGYDVSYAKGFSVAGEDVPELVDEALALAKMSDVVVVFAGLPQSYETEGIDRRHLDLPDNQNRLIKALTEFHDKVVVVLHTGSVVLLPWFNQVEAVLNVNLGGDSVGQATVDLLYGEVNPSGKLAETWPMQLEDNPSYLNYPGELGMVDYKEGIYIGYRYYDKKKMAVRFPFGYGLSYTTFTYSDLTVDKNELADTEELLVSLTVKNTGAVFGKEVVQLYVTDIESTVHRPVRELKAFAKIALEPGEEKVVNFSLDKRAFAYYETRLHDWYVESGEFVIAVGRSSRDIQLEASVKVTATTTIPVEIHRYATIGDAFGVSGGMEKIMRLIQQRSSQSGQDTSTDEALGGDSSHMMESLVGMPLFSFYTFGLLSLVELDALVDELNGKYHHELKNTD